MNTKQTGMHGKDLSFYRPSAGTSVHVAQLTSCLDLKSTLQLTIKSPHVQSFSVTSLSATSHVAQTLIIRFHNGAVKPSDVGQSPLSCKYAMLQSQRGYIVFPLSMKPRIGLGVAPTREPRPETTTDSFHRIRKHSSASSISP